MATPTAATWVVTVTPHYSNLGCHFANFLCTHFQTQWNSVDTNCVIPTLATVHLFKREVGQMNINNPTAATNLVDRPTDPKATISRQRLHI